MEINTVSRFSSKAEKYAKYRPDYSPDAIQAIFEHTKLTAESRVADIGSGTGTVSRYFIENGNPVYAIEPNPGMRRMAEIHLGKQPNFHSVCGNSEETTLPNASIDLRAKTSSVPLLSFIPNMALPPSSGTSYPNDVLPSRRRGAARSQ